MCMTMLYPIKNRGAYPSVVVPDHQVDEYLLSGQWQKTPVYDDIESHNELNELKKEKKALLKRKKELEQKA